MSKHECKGLIIAASLLIVVQYVLAFFIIKLQGYSILQGIGWVICLFFHPLWFCAHSYFTSQGWCF